MKQEVIREMTTPELVERLEEEAKHFVKMKINHAVSPLENPMVIKEQRIVIARIKTELRKRELEQQ